MQRVRHAEVAVDGATAGRIAAGWLVLLGVAPTDTHKEVEWLADKVANPRAFPDDAGKMNRSVIPLKLDAKTDFANTSSLVPRLVA